MIYVVLKKASGIGSNSSRTCLLQLSVVIDAVKITYGPTRSHFHVLNYGAPSSTNSTYLFPHCFFPGLYSISGLIVYGKRNETHSFIEM